MSHASLKLSLASLLATTLASACGSPTDTTPPPPPATATLAFTMDSSIYLISSDTGATPSLLLSGFIEPSWSPDGSVLAVIATGPPFIEFFPPTQALFLADADGGNARQLAGLDWPIVRAALWAPDGSSMLFTRARSFPYSETMYRISPAGVFIENQFITGYTVPPSWSHDGSLVALGNSDISLVDVASGDTLGLLPGNWPQCSPVNDDIAFREATTGHIHLIRPDSSADRDLQVEGYPRIWSPDGTRLAFEGTDGMYMINADGSHLSRIGPLNVEVSDVAWSADGQRIAYVTHATSGPRIIYMARADDSDRRPVVTADEVCCLAWRPEATLSSRSSP